MYRLKTILVVILTVAIAAAGMPVYAGTGCAMKFGIHSTMKDCPDCAEHSDNHDQAQHKGKCCGSMDCAVSCSSVISMNMPTDTATAFLPVVHDADAVRLSDDAIFSFFIPTQERPPKNLA